MTPELLQFLGSLAAVAGIVLLAHILGFTRQARLESEDEARELFALLPGGFTAEMMAVGRDGHGAIASDSHGRFAVLVPHGTQFVPRMLDRGAHAQIDGDLLSIRSPDIGSRPVVLDLGEDAKHWAEKLTLLTDIHVI